MKGTGYPLHSPVSPSLPLPCVTVCHQVSNALYTLTDVPYQACPTRGQQSFDAMTFFSLPHRASAGYFLGSERPRRDPNSIFPQRFFYIEEPLKFLLFRGTEPLPTEIMFRGQKSKEAAARARRFLQYRQFRVKTSPRYFEGCLESFAAFKNSSCIP